ncbi:MAG TPA: shikimate kinase [Nitrospiraceae bacterium]|jgi:shikimate kinase|nr:shikimate kinase [Nitrospiraceae bacterium]
MENIVLTGFMGTGKTAIGRELSNMLRWRLIDVDEEIVKTKKMSINEIFSRFGEPAFRDIETATIREIASQKHVIISTGGGAVLRRENMDILKQNGVIVNLSATPDTIITRTSGNNERPLLQVENPSQRIKELLEVRRSFYEKADIMIDTESKTPHQIAEEILESIGWKR